MTIRQIAISLRQQQRREARQAAQKRPANGIGYLSNGTKFYQAEDGHRHFFGLTGEIEGMCATCYPGRKIIDVSPSVIQQVKDAALASSKDGCGYNDGDYMSPIIKSYIKTVPVGQRQNAAWTLNRAWFDEVDRIGRYIHSKDPNWTVWGQPFDTSILDDYRQGIDMKAWHGIHE